MKICNSSSLSRPNRKLGAGKKGGQLRNNATNIKNDVCKFSTECWNANTPIYGILIQWKSNRNRLSLVYSIHTRMIQHITCFMSRYWQKKILKDERQLCNHGDLLMQTGNRKKITSFFKTGYGTYRIFSYKSLDRKCLLKKIQMDRSIVRYDGNWWVRQKLFLLYNNDFHKYGELRQSRNCWWIYK